jgi:hypothetical protein
MRVCELHRERAVDTLTSKRDGSEYDLCPQCVELLRSILDGEVEEKPQRVVKRRRTRKIATATS